MLEIPEAYVLARQLNDTIKGQRITQAIAGGTPHKLAFFSGDPAEYNDYLSGETFGESVALAGLLEISAGPRRLLLGDGVGLRYHAPGEKRPLKHQLLIELDSGAAISATIQMYGGIWCFIEGQNDNKYYIVAREKPSPLTESFDQAYFQQMISDSQVQKLSLKALLATEQRIPGLGNGVLQDILWKVGLHPKRKVQSLNANERNDMFSSVKSVIQQMTTEGGRDTEKDLFGRSGGYATVMSKKNLDKPCPVCGTNITKQAYMGGSIYVCPGCQPL